MVSSENRIEKRIAGRFVSLLWRLLAICVLVSLAAGSSAAGLSGIPGIFVDIGCGARPAAMGGAFVALADDINSVAWNPAGLVSLKSTQATVMYANQMSLVPYYFVAFGQNLTGTQAHGEAIIHTGDDALSESTVLLAYASSASKYLPSPFDRLQAGLCIKLRQASFGNNADGGEERSQGSGIGFGLDLGVQWLATEKVTFGCVARDLLNSVSYNNNRTEKYSESVPATFTVGVAVRPSAELNVAVDFDKALYGDTQDGLHFGIERVVYKDIFTLRSGFCQILGPEPQRNFPVGLGIRYALPSGAVFALDFAYLFQKLANTPRVSTTLLF